MAALLPGISPTTRKGLSAPFRGLRVGMIRKTSLSDWICEISASLGRFQVLFSFAGAFKS
ncbi:probable inactive receptor kinase at1g27190 [Phtheirospermum japonicum]|uniref:Probable inactive receptor kinase at1g27190 n=1 Tax=Phtheirospermum japonicum TaxID=374723 RepID=A0A830B527_9LAMI|nr:probable inactive receptor kinase at1g27190 [Phtheirospermum japonicum]